MSPFPSWRRGSRLSHPRNPRARHGGPTWCPVAVGGVSPELGWKEKPAAAPLLCPATGQRPFPGLNAAFVLSGRPCPSWPLGLPLPAPRSPDLLRVLWWEEDLTVLPLPGAGPWAQRPS